MDAWVVWLIIAVVLAGAEAASAGLLLLRDGRVLARQSGALPLPALRSWIDGALK